MANTILTTAVPTRRIGRKLSAPSLPKSWVKAAGLLYSKKELLRKHILKVRAEYPS